MGEIFWICALVLFGVAEAATAQLVSIWFVAGAFASLIAAMLGANGVVQITVFIAVSVVALVATRPLVKKITEKSKIPTNADSHIGKKVVVSEEINNLEQRGRVKLAGVEWSARSEIGAPVASGEVVEIVKIEGVKLIVRKDDEV